VNKQKLLIVGGGGMVGATAAYACALRSVIEEIVLIDRNEDLAWGQAADINDAMGIDRNVVVHTGNYSDINDDDIVVITALSINSFLRHQKIPRIFGGLN
jgi:L-lactate dehydrogenase